MLNLYKRWGPLLLVLMLLALPILTGVAVGMRWPTLNNDYYGTMAQIIATLFIAVAVDFFADDKRALKGVLDRVLIVGLITLSWTGLFGCARAMLGGGGARMSALAATGLMSSSVLVSLALFARVAPSDSQWPIKLVPLLLLPPVILLIFV